MHLRHRPVDFKEEKEVTLIVFASKALVGRAGDVSDRCARLQSRVAGSRIGGIYTGTPLWLVAAVMSVKLEAQKIMKRWRDGAWILGTKVKDSQNMNC